jgi:nitrogen fixation NifU-like protein
MSDLRELYQEVILDHGRNPRHCHALPGANRRAEGHNPLCGDRLTVYARVERERVEEIGFEGSGCAISVASASLMSESLAGATTSDVERISREFHEVVTGRSAPEAAERLGKLAVFAGVREFPVRVKCATLAWHTLRAALLHDETPVTTE